MVSEMAALLEHLLEEIKGGLLTTVENRAIAATFDDLLDHGAEYLRYGRKNEAGVIAGIVFEDTIGRICRVSEILERDNKNIKLKASRYAIDLLAHRARITIDMDVSQLPARCLRKLAIPAASTTAAALDPP